MESCGIADVPNVEDLSLFPEHSSATEGHPKDREAIHSDRRQKAQLGQFMTPDRVACYMASLFSKSSGAVRLLDAGAGVGSLTTAFIKRWGDESVTVVAYEIDPALVPHLRTRSNVFLMGTLKQELSTVISFRKLSTKSTSERTHRVSPTRS